MGICENERPIHFEPSFRCTYDVTSLEHEVRIINDWDGDSFSTINDDIKSKVKILKDNKKEELVFN